MNSSIISSLGLGAGFDTAALVRDLAAASRDPKVELFDRREAAARAKISAVGQARSTLMSFSNSLAELVNSGVLQSQPVSSDEAVIGVAPRRGAAPGAINAQISVAQLATAQTSYSEALGSRDAPVGQGTLQLSSGTRTATIVIGPDNDSLAGLAAAITGAGIGLRASLISDQGSVRLVVKGDSGSANAFTIAVAPGSAPELERFGSGTGSTMTVAQMARDAQFSVDGIPFTRPTNVIEDALPGVLLTLKAAAPATSVAISATRPSEAIRTSMGDFVSVFNELRGDVRGARAVVGGDQSMRMIEQALAAFVTQPVLSTGTVRSLADIGVATNRDGSISLNAATFERALRDYPDEVEALFNPPRDEARTATTDPGLSQALAGLAGSLTRSGGAIASLDARLAAEVTNLTKQRERMEAREARFAESLERRFSGLDARVGALRATQSYLDQQIKLWTRSA